MPLKFDMVRGKPALFYLVHLGTVTTAPATTTVTVGAAGAAAGATSIPTTALPGPIPKNTVLTFTRSEPGDDPATMQVVVTADALEDAVTISVEDFNGADGDGIPYSLVSTDAATWDGLYTDIASESLDFQVNAQTQELSPVTHGSATGVSVSLPEITSIAPSVTRQGLFFSNSQVVEDLLTYGDTNANWWGKLVQPDNTGAPWVTRQGLGVVSGLGTPTPADNLIQLSYTFRFKTAVSPTFPT